MSHEMPIRAPLPEDSLINAEIVVTSYFAGNGKLMYCTKIAGDVNIAQALGLLELAKRNILDIYGSGANERGSDEDDEHDQTDGG